MLDTEGATSGMVIYQRSKWTGETWNLEENYKPETATDPEVDMLDLNCSTATTADPQCSLDFKVPTPPEGLGEKFAFNIVYSDYFAWTLVQLCQEHDGKFWEEYLVLTRDKLVPKYHRRQIRDTLKELAIDASDYIEHTPLKCYLEDHFKAGF